MSRYYTTQKKIGATKYFMHSVKITIFRASLLNLQQQQKKVGYFCLDK